jgi:hypothetical protein
VEGTTVKTGLPEGTYTVYEDVTATKVYTVHLDGTTDLGELLEGYAELCDDWEGDNDYEQVALIVKGDEVVWDMRKK